MVEVFSMERTGLNHWRGYWRVTVGHIENLKQEEIKSRNEIESHHQEEIENLKQIFKAEARSN